MLVTLLSKVATKCVLFACYIHQPQPLPEARVCVCMHVSICMNVHVCTEAADVSLCAEVKHKTRVSIPRSSVIRFP